MEKTLCVGDENMQFLLTGHKMLCITLLLVCP